MSQVTTLDPGERRFVVTRSPLGGVTVRRPSADPTSPATGPIAGCTVSAFGAWHAFWRDGSGPRGARGNTSDEAEQLLRAGLGMPPRTVPLDPWGNCMWCGEDPDSRFCCAGDHPDRYAFDAELAELAELPVIPFGGSRG